MVRMEPGGIQKALRRAVEDAEFRNAYLSNPVEAAREAGIELAEDEVRILHSIEPQQLRDAISRIQDCLQKGKAAPAAGRIEVNLKPSDGIGGIRPGLPMHMHLFRTNPGSYVTVMLILLALICVPSLSVYFLVRWLFQ